ncbi:fluoride efflux transporter CrcB [Roseomonas sp. NAR14]|uniref:Fluoride-specific ion channel FluC n=1 Tax=Roseomonas acroporae TaxID=2937791 RepID=A0A9X1YD02_9PROT|nr:fluoride efflux transporter CrcB [Roseomonas acroporae]MCK8787522.1 fluoride efflux transporter CrcB [Roseomonas acroporae]
MAMWLAVALGGAVGSVGRYGLGLLAARLWGETFPWGTLLINILGSFVITLFGALTGPGGAIPAGAVPRIFVMVGICGGFTTFSSFSLQTLALLQAGEPAPAMLYVVLSVALCLLGAFLGWWLGSLAGHPGSGA